MNAKELKSILQALQDHDVNEVSLETSDYKLSVKRGADQIQYVNTPQPVVSYNNPALQTQNPQQVSPNQTATAVSVHAAASAPVVEVSNLLEVKAPIVGSFYSAPSPEAKPFVKEGDDVKKGQILCIIEAMKLMNEIESEYSGTIRKILLTNGEPVEYGQVLFMIEPA